MIDPGTGILGFGVIEVTNSGMKLVDAGVITTPAHTSLDVRLEDIFDSLTEIITNTKPDFMSIEKLFFAQNVTTAMSVSHARGVAMLAGRKGGLKGGKARANNLTANQRKDIAKKAAEKRWGKSLL